MALREKRHPVLSYLNTLIRAYSHGERRPDIVARLCMVVDWCIDHPEYAAKIKVIPKKGIPSADAVRVLRYTNTGKEIRTFKKI